MIVTSIDQVQELLGIGVDPTTADMSYIKSPRDGKTILVTGSPIVKDEDIPCWTMGALWKICQDRKVCLEFLTDESPESVIDNMVKAIIEDIEERDEQSLDFIKRSISK